MRSLVTSLRVIVLLLSAVALTKGATTAAMAPPILVQNVEIGRASCRERVYVLV